eukprot:m.42063 g.42063  ORF g.42063 m.42063 type:complete len:643 (+) comp11510_c0_seq2:155-2083(+)
MLLLITVAALTAVASGGGLDVVPCAMVCEANTSMPGSHLNCSRVVQALCGSGDLGRPCDVGCLAGQAALSGTTCETEDAEWLQTAVYRAAERLATSSQATTTFAAHVPSSYPLVIMGPGVYAVHTPLPVWAPFGPSTGLHLPSGVHLRAACPARQAWEHKLPANMSVIEVDLDKRLTGSAPPPLLRSVVLVSDHRTGFNASTITSLAVHDTSVSGFAINGLRSGSSQGQRVCSTSSGGPAPLSALGAYHGIAVAAATGNVTLRDNVIAHVAGNAINTGMYDQWLPEDPACNATAVQLDALHTFCEGRVLRFSAPWQQPNVIANNIVCDAQFGGVTIIGDNTLVSGNIINVTVKNWVSRNQSFGLTMGVSAGFVGTHNVTVIKNTISGADYAVGSDGSYPLHVTVSLFVRYWAVIYARGTAAFRQRYSPNHPPLTPDGQLNFTTVEDFVRSNQVLLDIAVSTTAQSNDSTVYDAGFNTGLDVINNTLRGSVCGVSLYRAHDSVVSGNRIFHGPEQNLAMVGISLSNAHGCWVYGNSVNGSWDRAIQLVGQPRKMSRWGSSFNRVGVRRDGGVFVAVGNVLEAAGVGIDLTGCGYDNAVRNNTVMVVGGAGQPCSYRGARCQRQPHPAWATGNTPPSCNAGYPC